MNSKIRSIEIDFEVHQLIEMEKRGFDDSDNAALRRLLKLGDKFREQSRSQKIRKKTTGEDLNRAWRIGARQSRYREVGCFYEHLERFPGALCDSHGYVLFKTAEEYENCPELQHRKKLNVRRPGISGIQGYVKVR